MASQYLTIAKIGGEASVETLRQFREWHGLRTYEDSHEFEPKQWPLEVRNAAENWAEQLRDHGHEPPVVFFMEYVDLWSFCPPARFLADADPIALSTDRYDLFCLPLPLSPQKRAYLSEIQRDGQYVEDRLFAALTLHAADDWSELVDQAVLVFMRKAVRGSTMDAEIKATLSGLPEWMQRLV